MKLDRVTITGADDSVQPWELAALSAEFPFVEWGILFSLSSVGKPRFPTLDWTTRLPGGLNYSAHLCGRYVRDVVLDANLTWFADANVWGIENLFQRVQLNFHGQFHRQHECMAGRLRETEKQFILQCDGPNDNAVRELTDTCESHDRTFTPLFDTSGGAGRLPSHWPQHWPKTYCGYAGGLGPDNVVAQLHGIAQKSAGNPFWIDMERRVRSDDDRQFDLAKVRDVLVQCAPLVTP